MIGSKILLAYRKRLINVRLENFVASSFGRGYSFRRCKMQIQEGYVYHINDGYLYFKKVQDDKLIQDKENGTYRPDLFLYPLVDSVPTSY